MLLHTLRYLFGCSVVIVFASCTPPSPLPTPTPFVSSAIESALSTADTLGVRVDSDMLTRDFEVRLQSDPNNVRARVILAQFYMTAGDFRAAIQHLEIALELNPELSDTYCVFGDVMYELGLMNMVLRLEFLDSEGSGPLVFQPGEVSREVFRRAVEAYNYASKEASESLTLRTEEGGDGVIVCDMKYKQDHLERASLYASGQAPEDTAYTTDQMKALMWLGMQQEQLEEMRRREHINLIAETQDWFITNINSTDRDDRTYLSDVINLVAELGKYIAYCQWETPTQNYLTQRSQASAAIIQHLSDLDLDPRAAAFSPIVTNTCLEAQEQANLGTSVIEHLESENRFAAINLFNLMPAKFSLEVLAEVGINQLNRLAQQMERAQSVLILSDDLKTETSHLFEDINQSHTETEWTEIKSQLDDWFEDVVIYSLGLP